MRCTTERARNRFGNRNFRINGFKLLTLIKDMLFKKVLVIVLFDLIKDRHIINLKFTVWFINWLTRPLRSFNGT
jgi:hypothetical protein